MPRARRSLSETYTRLLGALAVALLLALTAVAFAPHANAVSDQLTDWHISDYHADLTVERNGDVQVREAIAVDFTGSAHHGIDREIQTHFRYDDVKKDYDRVTPIDQVQVTGSPGTPTILQRKDNGDLTTLRIGDKDKTISGPHTYTISYRIRGVLNHFADHDELYWNVVGTGWSVPIDHAGAALTLPGPVEKVTCFAGSDRSTLPCDSAQQAGNQATFEQGSLRPYQGLTLVSGLAPGAVVPAPKPILQQRWTMQRAFALRADTLAPAGVLLIAVAGAFIALLWRKGRDERFVGGAADQSFGNADNKVERAPLRDSDPIPIEFAPPDKLRPGQVGTLIDGQANTLDVTATIVDLAVRGHLRITEIPKEGLLGHTDWTLTRLDSNDDLKPYEKTLMSGMFKARDEIDLSELKDHFHTTLVDVEDKLYDDTVTQGWFKVRPDSIRNRWHGRAVALIVIGVIATWLLARATSYGLVGLPIIVGGILLLIGARYFSRRTARGHATYRRILGFKQFIDESEKERAQFAERQNLFSEYLPYAVVFGATEKWARAFAGIDGQLPQQSWYVGPHPFTVIAFGSAMSSFATTTSGTIASVPASSGSSGFGGGGFSGGGFGGGGGGAW